MLLPSYQRPQKHVFPAQNMHDTCMQQIVHDYVLYTIDRCPGLLFLPFCLPSVKKIVCRTLGKNCVKQNDYTLSHVLIPAVVLLVVKPAL